MSANGWDVGKTTHLKIAQPNSCAAEEEYRSSNILMNIILVFLRAQQLGVHKWARDVTSTVFLQNCKDHSHSFFFWRPDDKLIF